MSPDEKKRLVDIVLSGWMIAALASWVVVISGRPAPEALGLVWLGFVMIGALWGVYTLWRRLRSHG